MSGVFHDSAVDGKILVVHGKHEIDVNGSVGIRMDVGAPVIHFKYAHRLRLQKSFFAVLDKDGDTIAHCRQTCVRSYIALGETLVNVVYPASPETRVALPPIGGAYIGAGALLGAAAGPFFRESQERLRVLEILHDAILASRESLEVRHDEMPYATECQINAENLLWEIQLYCKEQTSEQQGGEDDRQIRTADEDGAGSPEKTLSGNVAAAAYGDETDDSECTTGSGSESRKVPSESGASS